MKKTSTALVCLLVVGPLAFAQQPAGTRKQPKRAESRIEAAKQQLTGPTPQSQFTPRYFEAGIPLTVYQANDPIKVFDWLTKYIAETPGKPDQFSTPDEKRTYESTLADRLKSVGQIPMIGMCQKKYDGDRQLYEIKAVAHSIKNYYSIKEVDARAQNIKVLNLSTVNLKEDSYTGQNAYGAETRISRTTADIYAVAFPLNKAPTSVIVDGSTRLTSIPLPYDIDFKYLQLDVAMSSADARVNDKDIACLFMLSIAPPYVLKFNERSTPTRDLPFDSAFNYYAIYGSLDQVAVINKTTGNIYEQAAR